MSSIERYRRNITKKRDQLQRLSSKKSRETTRMATYNKEIMNAKNSIARTKSEATIKSRLNKIKRVEKSLVRVNKNISNIDKKIASITKQLSSEEKRLSNKLKEVDKKKVKEEQRRLKASRQMSQQLEEQIRVQSDMQEKLTNLENIPEKITVLFMASDPEGSGASLQLDEEARSIQKMIRKTEYRDNVKFETRWATRPLDILQAINELNPSIVHFSGHGSDNDELVLQNIDGSPRFVTKEAIVQTMMTSSDKIRLVFFNTCFSHGQAEEVVRYVEAAIGMNDSVSDHAARIFSSHFYSAIGFGKSLEKSFEQAKAALMLEGILEENIPELYTKEGIEANSMLIVRPNP